MNREKYPVKSSDDKKRHEFFSEGPRGRIKKVVMFQELGLDYYNLAFSDWDVMTDELDYKSRSNNGDRDKILATIVSIILEFMNYYPGAIVQFRGQIPAKTRLYQAAINKCMQDLNYGVIVEGYCDRGWEKFQSGKNYEMFIVRNRKNL